MKNSKDLLKIQKHYDDLFSKYKNSYKTSQQSSRTTQEKRMQILTNDFKLKKSDKVLDFGCGTAYLYNYLLKTKKFNGLYTGIDLSKKIIDFNKTKFKHNSRVNFLNQNILEKNCLLNNYDYIIINGTFNNKTSNNWSWMKLCLKKLFLKTNKVLAFNNLSIYVDYFDKNLFYVKPEKVFKFCKKNLSKYVILKHDYQIKKNIIPYEFTTYVFKKDKN